MLGGELAVLQAPMFDGLSLDPFTLFDDGWCPAEVDVCRRHIVHYVDRAKTCPYLACLCFYKAGCARLPCSMRAEIAVLGPSV
jgi:hypothetical protein